jgi:hypothetical protein
LSAESCLPLDSLDIAADCADNNDSNAWEITRGPVRPPWMEDLHENGDDARLVFGQNRHTG